ncbi:unnamed protein product [Caenorhabditis auriculariae]|uniref:Secreted protein n=1 Tax=Caenorhabditis auriculariae TaxID=2777116 RepID=A0A8S1HP40_9PELO|nr:unnamed protein product [Caenorhabditis auriculariae]
MSNFCFRLLLLEATPPATSPAKMKSRGHFRRPVYSLVLPVDPHYFPTLAVTPGRIGQRLWIVTRADD